MAEYFRLMQDRRIPHAVMMTKLNLIPDYRKAIQGDISVLDTGYAMPVQSSKLNVYPSVLDRQLFMVKEPVLSVLKMYQPNLTHSNMYLLDNNHDICENYYIPHFTMVDCLSKTSTGLPDRSIIKNVVLQRNCMPDYIEFFRIGGVGDCVIIISLAVAESLLRRKINDVAIKPVEIIGGDNDA